MMDSSRIVFIHGSDSNGQTYKARVLRKHFPLIFTPDFKGPLEVRLAQLETIIQDKKDWTLIGSSLGGLIATLFAIRHPEQVRQLILLAPALHVPELANRRIKPIFIPTVLIIGKKDDVIPVQTVYNKARRIFPKLTYLSVDDDHRLHHTTDHLDWESLLE